MTGLSSSTEFGQMASLAYRPVLVVAGTVAISRVSDLPDVPKKAWVPVMGLEHLPRMYCPKQVHSAWNDL